MSGSRILVAASALSKSRPPIVQIIVIIYHLWITKAKGV